MGCEFLEKIPEEYREEVKKIIGDECYESVIHNADLEEMPAVYVDDMVVYYDPRTEEVYSEYYRCIDSGGFDVFNLMTLDPKYVGVCVPDSEVEALRDYGNGFALIMKVGDYFVKVSGSVYGKLVELFIPYDDIPFSIHDELDRKLDEILPEVFRVLADYTNVQIDAWRTLSQSASNKVNGLVKVVEGWVGLMSSSPSVERLSRVSKLKEDPPVVPMLFVFPRSSNITVAYFDVWVPADKKEKFIEWFGDVDEFSFSDGVYVKSLT